MPPPAFLSLLVGIGLSGCYTGARQALTPEAITAAGKRGKVGGGLLGLECANAVKSLGLEPMWLNSHRA